MSSKIHSLFLSRCPRADPLCIRVLRLDRGGPALLVRRKPDNPHAFAGADSTLCRQTDDSEWYDPDGAVTAGGFLVLTLSVSQKVNIIREYSADASAGPQSESLADSHDLGYIGAMLQVGLHRCRSVNQSVLHAEPAFARPGTRSASPAARSRWPRLCLATRSARDSGPPVGPRDDLFGVILHFAHSSRFLSSLLPAWTIGNLGHAGYGATLDVSAPSDAWCGGKTWRLTILHPLPHSGHLAVRLRVM